MCSLDVLSANQRRVDSRSGSPARTTRTTASARLWGEASAAIAPFTPSSTSSTAAFSDPATITLGVP